MEGEKKKSRNWQRDVASICGSRRGNVEPESWEDGVLHKGYVNWGLELNTAASIHREPQQQASADSHINPYRQCAARVQRHSKCMKETV